MRPSGTLTVGFRYPYESLVRRTRVCLVSISIGVCLVTISIQRPQSYKGCLVSL
jgi:hypothetical protein